MSNLPFSIGSTNCGNIADIDGNCKVDIFDYNLLVGNFGKTSGTPTPTNRPTATPTTKPTISPPATPIPGQSKGIWISKDRVMKLPISGSAWNNLKSAADSSPGDTKLTTRNTANTITLAKALVYARTGESKYKDEVINIVMGVIGTEDGGDDLAVFRRIEAYVVAADLVGLPSDKDTTFRSWLRQMLTKKLSSWSVTSNHDTRPNNWGTHAGGSRAAIAAYLGDEVELARVAQVFKGWLGDRLSYAGFDYGDLSWQCDPAKPVGINPKGCIKLGHSIDGVLPDDQRRGGGFSWPPPKENYVYGGLQGALSQAIILFNAGYDTWNWEDKALLRAFQWLHNEANFPATGDDVWEPWIINYYYGTSFPAPSPTQPGKNTGWTDWTHSK